jgi:hypothetical protein
VAVAASTAASAAITPPATWTPPATVPSFLTFVPPRVGAISVDLGATIIDGKVIAPPVHVLMPEVKMPAFTWARPAPS